MIDERQGAPAEHVPYQQLYERAAEIERQQEQRRAYLENLGAALEALRPAYAAAIQKGDIKAAVELLERREALRRETAALEDLALYGQIRLWEARERAQTAEIQERFTATRATQEPALFWMQAVDLAEARGRARAESDRAKHVWTLRRAALLEAPHD